MTNALEIVKNKGINKINNVVDTILIKIETIKNFIKEESNRCKKLFENERKILIDKICPEILEESKLAELAKEYLNKIENIIQTTNFIENENEIQTP